MKHWIFIGITIVLLGCGFDDAPQLPAVEERVEEAISDLRDLLVAPADGWSIDYRPNANSGSFPMILNFDEEGMVRIQSDISANNGQLVDRTIPYRIDAAQGIELILETYAAFHYLFELDQATFDGEFEFIFEEEQGGNLIFTSKTDVGTDITTLTFSPASTADIAALSAATYTELGQAIFQTENLAGISSFVPYNLYIEANDHTVSTTINLDRRVMTFHGIAQGQTMADIIANGSGVSINLEVKFGIANQAIQLDQSVNVSLGGVDYSITEIPLQNFNQSTATFCTGQQEDIIGFNSDAVTGLGDVTISSSLFQTHSTFLSENSNFFSVNYPFLFNENDSTIREDIEAVFPQVAAFQWYTGVEVSDSVLNAVGFVTVDELNNALFFLREFDLVENGNQLVLTFTGNNFITASSPTTEQINGLAQLTDDIFSGGEVYLFEIEDRLYEFYNPCNKYKGFLIRPES